MSKPRLYIDEDVHGFMARALKLRGWEVLTTQEAGQSGQTDEQQLSFATRKGYAFLTYNVRDFSALHGEFLESGRSHHGIVSGRQRLHSRNLHPLLRLLSTVSAAALENQLIFLSTWEGDRLDVG